MTTTCVDRVANVFGLLGNETRIRIAINLAGGERRVGDLAAGLGELQPTVSKHLTQMRAQGLVAFRRAGPVKFYALTAVGHRLVDLAWSL
jgi:DNA-binding transcriptional ArsR family regulator